MKLEKVLISRKSLAERWDFESTESIQNYEKRGILTRNPHFEAPRYYMEEIIKIESLGEVNPLSPLERRKLEKRIKELEDENLILKDKIANIKVLLGQLLK